MLPLPDTLGLVRPEATYSVPSAMAAQLLSWLALASLVALAPSQHHSSPHPPVTTTVVYGVRPRGLLGLAEKNSADARGDAYFLLSRLAVTYQICIVNPAHFDCHCEITCDDNVVTSYVLHTYTPVNYSGYRNCNPVPNSTLANYSYYCDAGDPRNVGAIRTGTFPWSPAKGEANYLSIWRHKLGVHMGGTWYSSMAASECTSREDATAARTYAGTMAGQREVALSQPKLPCTWNATAIKVLDKTCLVSR